MTSHCLLLTHPRLTSPKPDGRPRPYRAWHLALTPRTLVGCCAQHPLSRSNVLGQCLLESRSLSRGFLSALAPAPWMGLGLLSRTSLEGDTQSPFSQMPAVLGCLLEPPDPFPCPGSEGPSSGCLISPLPSGSLLGLANVEGRVGGGCPGLWPPPCPASIRSCHF